MELAAVVVVPARNEELRIAACLESLAAQTVPAAGFETIVVLDGCTDRTESVAAQAANALGLQLRLLQGPGAGGGLPVAPEWTPPRSDCSDLVSTTAWSRAPMPIRSRRRTGSSCSCTTSVAELE